MNHQIDIDALDYSDLSAQIQLDPVISNDLSLICLKKSPKLLQTEQTLKKILNIIANILESVSNIKSQFLTGKYQSFGEVANDIQKIVNARIDIGLKNLPEDQVKDYKVIGSGTRRMENRILAQKRQIMKLQRENAEIKDFTPSLKLDSIKTYCHDFKFNDQIMMSMELSNYYETLPESFQRMIPKTHPNLPKLMEMFQDLKERKNCMVKWDSNYKLMDYLVNSQKIHNYKIFCTYCFMRFKAIQELTRHISIYHNQDTDGQSDPYYFLKLFCVTGCGFFSESIRELRRHCIMMHSFLQLRDYNINRWFLMLIEQMISIKDYNVTLGNFKDKILQNKNQRVQGQKQEAIMASKRSEQVSGQVSGAQSTISIDLD